MRRPAAHVSKEWNLLLNFGIMDVRVNRESDIENQLNKERELVLIEMDRERNIG